MVDTDALQQRIRELEEQNKKLESELALVKQQVNSTTCQHKPKICGRLIYMNVSLLLC